jgi:serine protease Do
MRWIRGSRRAWPLATLVAVLAPQLGFTASAPKPLWTEGAINPAPVAPPAASPGWVQLARELKPAVVNVSTKRVQDGLPTAPDAFRDKAPFEQFFKEFFGNMPRREVRSLGSGFIINPQGYIVTNNHVVDGAKEIRVKLADGRELPATVVGRDPKTDLSLLKVEATGLTVIPPGDSSELQVGEPVMAIGNPFGLEQTVTTGVVSATGRVIGEGPYDDFIQTDASINPGNSGGPLINARGQAVGINTSIFTQSGGSVGIGFAIPINLAKSVVTQLAEHGHVVRGWLGVSIQPITPDLAKAMDLRDLHGALVSSVVEGSPAMKAGLKAGDVITEYSGRRVEKAGDLPRAVGETPVGREVPLTVVRDGKAVKLTAKIARLQEPVEMASGSAVPGTPRLGLQVQPLTPPVARELGLTDRPGVLVSGVEDGSPAANAGIQAGDVIVQVDRHPIKSVEELKKLVDAHRAGTPILLLVERHGGALYVAVTA